MTRQSPYSIIVVFAILIQFSYCFAREAGQQLNTDETCLMSLHNVKNSIIQNPYNQYLLNFSCMILIPKVCKVSLSCVNFRNFHLHNVFTSKSLYFLPFTFNSIN